jgi:hypothetical protein
LEITLSRDGSELVWLFTKILLTVYYIAFIWVSYGVFKEAQLDHQFWIVPDIFRGIEGGMVLVYPFNVFRYGFDIIDKWAKWFFIYLFFFVISGIIDHFVFGID